MKNSLNIDLKLLQEQKNTLLDVVNKQQVTVVEFQHIVGVINLLEYLTERMENETI